MGGVVKGGRAGDRASIVEIWPGGKDRSGKFQVKATVTITSGKQSQKVAVSIPYRGSMTLKQLEQNIVKAAGDKWKGAARKRK